MYSNNSFITKTYKSGYIHTWITSSGRVKVQAQLGHDLKEFPTVTGCKRWITKQIKGNNS